MNKIRLLILVVWGALPVRPTHAQCTLFPYAPPPQFTFNDLWHATVNRPADDGYTQFYISLRIFSGNGMLQVKSNTAPFTLSVGSHYYHSANLSALQPFTTSCYGASVWQQTVSAGGIFPAGTYHFAYTLFGKMPDGEFVPLAEETSETTVEAMWPPMLLFPPDGDSIDSPLPLLSWTPAFSSRLAGSVSYTLHLVEILHGQNAYQAIRTNPGQYDEKNISATMQPYPSGARILEAGKQYAWQVQADADGHSLGSSEIWTFTLAGPKSGAPGVLPKYYYKPAEKVPAEYVRLTGAFLPLAFDERYQPASPEKPFTFNILDENRKTVGSEKDFDAPIQAGFNRYLVPVCSSQGKISLPKGRYHIEILLEKKTRRYLAFEIKETHCHE